MPDFAEWNSFYVIIGSAAGALIGLQFVVMTLVANRASSGTSEAGAAFATPSVVHFTVVLFLSAAASAPWHSVTAVEIFWGLAGFGGIVYCGVVTRRLRTQRVYVPVFEDWLFHSLLPLAAYGLLAGSAYLAHTRLHPALFGVAAATLLLLFVGIHNAWDAVTYHVFVNPATRRDTEPPR
jgi:hypothetical protein